DPLPPESADELLAALLGTDAALGPLKQLLVERTEANPLFLEESVRALVETAALVGERGAYRLTRPVENLKIPATEQAILAARIDEVASQGLLHDLQRALHARITEAIEQLAPARVAEQTERLAHHAQRGGLWEKAVAYLRQAGLRAMVRAANREASAHLEQALSAIRRLPE